MQIVTKVVQEGMAVRIADSSRLASGGEDTILNARVDPAPHDIGEPAGVEQFQTDVAGNRALGWLRSLGSVVRVSAQARGSCGVGLARHVRRAGVEVVEVVQVDRADRQERRRRTASRDPS